MDAKNVTIVILSIVVADSVRVHYVNRKRFASLKKTNKALLNENKRLKEYGMYLADKLDENEIPIDDFDRIVIDNM